MRWRVGSGMGGHLSYRIERSVISIYGFEVVIWFWVAPFLAPIRRDTLIKRPKCRYICPNLGLMIHSRMMMKYIPCPSKLPGLAHADDKVI